MIHVDGLVRRYGPVTALDGVSFAIDRGEIVGLLGHNGAGKTTLMKILTGYLEPSAGRVEVDGLDVVARRTAVQERLGYLPENAPLYTDMPVVDYLATMARLRGIPQERLAAAVRRAAERTGLLDHLARPIATLSKGYRQRVGLAQALIHQPEVLVLDEPTNGLDPLQIRAMRSLIRELGQESTVLLSTHILQEVEAVCERVIVLIEGTVAADAPLARLLESATVELCVDRDDGDIRGELARVPGVRAAALHREEGSRRWWRVEPLDGEDPVPALVRRAAEAGWTVHAVGRVRRTLQAVFEELQAAHAERAVREQAARAAS